VKALLAKRILKLSEKLKAEISELLLMNLISVRPLVLVVSKPHITRDNGYDILYFLFTSRGNVMSQHTVAAMSLNSLSAEGVQLDFQGFRHAAAHMPKVAMVMVEGLAANISFALAQAAKQFCNSKKILASDLSTQSRKSILIGKGLPALGPQFGDFRESEYVFEDAGELCKFTSARIKSCWYSNRCRSKITTAKTKKQCRINFGPHTMIEKYRMKSNS
jgi:hypothetical protein